MKISSLGWLLVPRRPESGNAVEGFHLVADDAREGTVFQCVPHESLPVPGNCERRTDFHFDPWEQSHGSVPCAYASARVILVRLLIHGSPIEFSYNCIRVVSTRTNGDADIAPFAFHQSPR